MDKPIKKGFLEAYTKGVGNSHSVASSRVRALAMWREFVWVRRFYTLFSQSERVQARLDWFPDEEAFVNSPSIRRTIYLEQIESVSIQPDELHSFDLVTKNHAQPYKFRAENSSQLSSWMSHLMSIKEGLQKSAVTRINSGKKRQTEEEEIYAAPEQASTYRVSITETESSQVCRLSGFYNIKLSEHHITLQDIASRTTIYSWPYKLIRRYGCNTNSFTLEAGRKCDSGPGVFTFESDISREIFDIVQKMTRLMKKNSAEESSPPSLPQRNYSAQKDETLPQEKNQRGLREKLRGVFRPNKKSDKQDTKANEVPHVEPAPPVDGEPMYHLYEQAKDVKTDGQINTSKVNFDYEEESAYSLPEESGGNSMSELAAAAILQEMRTSDAVEYDSLNLCNIPVAHKAKKNSDAEKNLYCELPGTKSPGEDTVYSEVNRLS
ncbi:hypothetical protein CAPTEDRAFT_222550 [Capitella teleta]|uniref:IRS-type PTB domain-containing protein n=1 Tax=Capitella teleta TaxID=283909 RepID=R7UTJ8_CAPTE|nr:hypothetical protein CAPTEDRAFT_222550 [Capitella teleta]|eukprot:ELU09839.1 hypothetical protein CAPTEDRAFT_222550 [Capitella teleta]